jgi:hypothetical protein
VALGSLSDSGFLVILGDCRHLASLLVAEIVEHHLGGCVGLRSLAIVRGFVLTPGDSQRSNSSKIN